jgi:hypothetical protein
MSVAELFPAVFELVSTAGTLILVSGNDCHTQSESHGGLYGVLIGFQLKC